MTEAQSGRLLSSAFLLRHWFLGQLEGEKEVQPFNPVVNSTGPGVLPSPCFSIFLARTTFVLESLPEAKNPGQDAIFEDFVFNSSNRGRYGLIDWRLWLNIGENIQII